MFGGPAISVLLGNRHVAVALEAPPPTVKIGTERRLDLLAGRVRMIVDAHSVVFVYLDLKVQHFDLDGCVHALQFKDGLRSVAIDGYTYRADFGGLPMAVHLDGRTHYVRFLALPRGVEPGRVLQPLSARLTPAAAASASVGAEMALPSGPYPAKASPKQQPPAVDIGDIGELLNKLVATGLLPAPAPPQTGHSAPSAGTATSLFFFLLLLSSWIQQWVAFNLTWTCWGLQVAALVPSVAPLRAAVGRPAEEEVVQEEEEEGAAEEEAAAVAAAVTATTNPRPKTANRLRKKSRKRRSEVGFLFIDDGSMYLQSRAIRVTGSTYVVLKSFFICNFDRRGAAARLGEHEGPTERPGVGAVQRHAVRQLRPALSGRPDAALQLAPRLALPPEPAREGRLQTAPVAQMVRLLPSTKPTFQPDWLCPHDDFPINSI